MIKYLLILITISFQLNTFAQKGNQTYSIEYNNVVESDRAKNKYLQNNLKSQVVRFNKMIDSNIQNKCSTEKLFQTEFKKCLVPKASKCAGVFINNDCSLGKIGLEMKKILKSEFKTRSGDITPFSQMIQFPPTDLQMVCPNYKNLDTNQKENFWIWTMGAVAAQEAECSSNFSGPLGDGTFQMDGSNTKRSELRPYVCRDSFIKQNYPGKSIKDIMPNTHCAMAMFAVSTAPKCKTCKNVKNISLGPCVTKKETDEKCDSCQLCIPPSERREDLKVLSRGALFSKNSYFRHLRHPDEKIPGLGNKSLKEVIGSYPYCDIQ